MLETLSKEAEVRLAKINMFINSTTEIENQADFEKIGFTKKRKAIYDLKIFLQTDGEGLAEISKEFKKVRAKKRLKVATSITGEITRRRYVRAIKTIWNSRILYIYEPWLIIKLLMRLIKNK